MSLDLDPIKQRLAAATPGPWRVKEGQRSLHRGTVEVEEFGRLIETVAECYCGGYEGHGRQNAELVAHAPEDLEALIEEVERLRAKDADASAECGIRRKFGWSVQAAARDAGLTYAAVRDILSGYQREDEEGTSFGYMVEALRELAVATALRLHERSDGQKLDG